MNKIQFQMEQISQHILRNYRKIKLLCIGNTHFPLFLYVLGKENKWLEFGETIFATRDQGNTERNGMATCVVAIL